MQSGSLYPETAVPDRDGRVVSGVRNEDRDASSARTNGCVGHGQNRRGRRGKRWLRRILIGLIGALIKAQIEVRLFLGIAVR